MPYINRARRGALQFEQLSHPVTSGELNYLLTLLCLEYLKEVGERYTTYNDIIGALECCKLEMYRRRIGNYEDQKIKENGDVY